MHFLVFTFLSIISLSLLGSHASLLFHDTLTSPHAEEIAHALAAGNLAKITQLYESLPVCTKLTKNGATALHLVASQSESAITQHLLENSAAAISVDKKTPSPFLAIKKGQLAIVRFLLSRSEYNYFLTQAIAPLHLAAYHGRADIVRMLADAGAHIDDCTCGFTPLFFAAQEGHRAVVAFLLARGSEPHNAAHSIALARGHANIARLLNSHIENRASPAQLSWLHDDLGRIFDQAVTKSRCDEMQRLIESHPEFHVDTVFWTGYTALHIAAREGALTFARYLLERGANVHSLHCRVTALWLATTHKNTDMLRLLLYYGARPNDGPYAYPILQAFTDEHQAVAKMLLAHHASLYVRDAEGDTPLHRAACMGNLSLEIARLFITAGAPVNAVNEQGETPLHCAAKACSSSMVQLLVDAGANLEVLNELRSTPLHYAAFFNNLEGARVLITADSCTDG